MAFEHSLELSMGKPWKTMENPILWRKKPLSSLIPEGQEDKTCPFSFEVG